MNILNTQDPAEVVAQIQWLLELKKGLPDDWETQRQLLLATRINVLKDICGALAGRGGEGQKAWELVAEMMAEYARGER